METNKQQKPTPFFKRVSDLEKKVEELSKRVEMLLKVIRSK